MRRRALALLPFLPIPLLVALAVTVRLATEPEETPAAGRREAAASETIPATEGEAGLEPPPSPPRADDLTGAGTEGDRPEVDRRSRRQPARGLPPAAAAGGRTIPSPTPPENPDDCMRIPVVGVRVNDLIDTFDEPRRGDDIHGAVDIIAPRGTPVVAAADGEVQKIWESVPGGHTLYLLGDGGRLRYYYAHLEAYRRGLEEGEDVDAGEVIGYVGDSGNAVPGNTHLHFAVLQVDEEENWAGGTPLDPLPFLRCEVPLPG